MQDIDLGKLGSDMEMEFHNMMLDIILGPDAASGGMGGSTNAGLSLGPRRNPQHGRRRGSRSDRQSTLSPFHALIMEMTTRSREYLYNFYSGFSGSPDL